MTATCKSAIYPFLSAFSCRILPQSQKQPLVNCDRMTSPDREKCKCTFLYHILRVFTEKCTVRKMYTKLHPEPEEHIFYIHTSGDIVVENEKAQKKKLPDIFKRVKYYHSDPR